MQNERQRILQLVENGTISAQEALTLLEALEKKPQSTVEAQATPLLEKEQPSEQAQSDDTKQPKWFDFDDDLFKKKEGKPTFESMQSDMTKLGTRLFDLLSTTLNRVKDFDVPHVGATEFEHTYTFEEAITEVAVDVPHGSVTIEPSLDDTIVVKCQVRGGLKQEEEAASQQTFFKRFVAEVDGKTLRLISDLKMTQVNLVLALPQKEYEAIQLKLINGAITVRDTKANKFRFNSYNGNISLQHASFKYAKLESRNGTIDIKHVNGRDLEVETMNGRVYVDGVVEEIDAKSLNGHVTVTTKTVFASKIKAETIAGNVELYIPKNMSLKGKLASNLGRIDVHLEDVVKHEEEQQFLMKSTTFEKEVEQSQKLYIDGQTKAGSISVRYTSVDNPTV